MSAAMKTSKLHFVQTPSSSFHHLSTYLNSYRFLSTQTRYISIPKYQRIYQTLQPTRCTLPEKELVTTETGNIARVEFSVAAALDFGLSFKMCGNCEQLGNWDLESAPMMTWTEGDVWILNVELPVGQTEAKLVAISSDGEFSNWEPGENRILQIPNVSNEEIVRFSLKYLETEKMEQSITESQDEIEPDEKIEMDTEDDESTEMETTEEEPENDLSESTSEQKTVTVQDVQSSVIVEESRENTKITNEEQENNAESTTSIEISSLESSSETTLPVQSGDLTKKDDLDEVQDSVQEKKTQETETAAEEVVQEEEQKKTEMDAKELVWLSVLGLFSIPIVGWSEWSLYKTGCGLPPGPVGLLGALEGISYLVIVGIVSYGVIRRLSRSSYQPSVLVETGSLLLVISGLVVLFSQIENYGYIPSALPDQNCPAEPTSVTVPEFFPK